MGVLACLGPYPNVAEKLDGVDLVNGTSYIALDAGAARILILASFDGGPSAPFTRIDEQQPRAVQTLQGTYSGDATNTLSVTFSSTTLFSLPNEASKPVSDRSGASRRQLSPPMQSKVHIDTSTDEVLDLSGSGDIAGHYLTLLGRTALVTGTDATASACAFHLANLAVESSEARIPGFNSPGLTQYLNREEPFDGILSGTVTIGLVGLFSPVTTNTFRNYADFEGVVLDGARNFEHRHRRQWVPLRSPRLPHRTRGAAAARGLGGLSRGDPHRRKRVRELPGDARRWVGGPGSHRTPGPAARAVPGSVATPRRAW